MAGKSNPDNKIWVVCEAVIVNGCRATGRSRAEFSVFVCRVLRRNRARPVGG